MPGACDLRGGGPAARVHQRHRIQRGSVPPVEGLRHGSDHYPKGSSAWRCRTKSGPGLLNPRFAMQRGWHSRHYTILSFASFSDNSRNCWPSTADGESDIMQIDVVRFGANIWKFLFIKQRHVIRFRPCKGMMHGVPFVFFRAPFKQRKIGHPEEIPLPRARRARPTKQILHFGDAQAEPAENLTGDFPFVRAEENAVAFLNLEFRL